MKKDFAQGLIFLTTVSKEQYKSYFLNSRE